MEITVQYQGLAARQSGCERETFILPQTATATDLLQQVLARHEPLQRSRRALFMAVNSKILPAPARQEYRLKPGDQVIISIKIIGG
ncbi:MAG TPA: MoaD/ThiS family protein [Bacillota bacterium]|nr:MoaD/ThiS family protein [Bacillota bacterium]